MSQFEILPERRLFSGSCLDCAQQQDLAQGDQYSRSRPIGVIRLAARLPISAMIAALMKRQLGKSRMSWRPISESEIWDMINDSRERMSLEQKRLWDVIQVVPEKWKQIPWGEEGDGFWVVGIIGRGVIWYNDIEGGFNRSNFTAFGEINEYWCNQDELEWTIQYLINQIRDGYDSAGYSGPPEPNDATC